MRGVAFSLVGFLMIGSANAEDAPTFDLALTGTVFSPAELHVPVGKAFVIKFKNNNSVPAELEAKDVKIEKIAAANSEIVVRVTAPAAGKFLFTNEYQEDEAKGYLVVE
jgi:plastocyanin